MSDPIDALLSPVTEYTNICLEEDEHPFVAALLAAAVTVFDADPVGHRAAVEAGSPDGVGARSIGISLDREPSQTTVIVNWPHTTKVSADTRRVAKAAVHAALPKRYESWRVSLT